ncbi:hypothetical protein BJX76DRAFT_339382 [Aspergillus varians]
MIYVLYLSSYHCQSIGPVYSSPYVAYWPLKAPTMADYALYLMPALCLCFCPLPLLVVLISCVWTITGLSRWG